MGTSMCGDVCAWPGGSCVREGGGNHLVGWLLTTLAQETVPLSQPRFSAQHTENTRFGFFFSNLE